ncbi:hypothetical protein GZL_01892 [Streptomyces sp. 769]|nr:hypothetical protein GZL_01892 [Streptomyces sp. 769]
MPGAHRASCSAAPGSRSLVSTRCRLALQPAPPHRAPSCGAGAAPEPDISTSLMHGGA